MFALKSGLLQTVLKELTSFTQSANVNNQDFLSKLIFTLSGLMRNFPFAQHEFLKLGGSALLSNLIRAPNSIKVKTKILTLTDDLMKEKVFNVGSLWLLIFMQSYKFSYAQRWTS